MVDYVKKNDASVPEKRLNLNNEDSYDDDNVFIPDTEIRPSIYDEDKETTLSLTNGKKLKVRELGEDYFGAPGGRQISVPLYSFEALQWFADQVLNYTKHNFDQVILITGDERSGKSSLAFHLADTLDPNWSLDNIGFTSEQVINITARAKSNSLIMMDEGSVSVHAADWNKREQLEFAKCFHVFGKMNLRYIITLPQKRYLNYSLRENRTHWWFHVTSHGVRRGWAQLHKSHHSKWKSFAWWTPVFTLKFPRYKGEKWDIYERDYKIPFIKKQLAGENVRKSDEKETGYVSRLHGALKKMHEEGHDAKKLSELFGYSRDHVYKILKEK